MKRFPMTRKFLQRIVDYLVFILFALCVILLIIPVFVFCFVDVEIFEPEVRMQDCKIMKSLDRHAKRIFEPVF